MKNLILCTAFWVCITNSVPSFSQTRIGEILAEIETNNTTLHALQKQMEARQLQNKTGIFPHNPEFGYAYYYGSPQAIGPKKNVSLMQSAEFPSVYFHQSRISRARNEQIETEYREQRKAILLEASMIYNDIIYTNALARQIDQRLLQARNLVLAFERMLELGESNVLEYNKVRLNLSSLLRQSEANNIERENSLAELQRLNGGRELSLDDTGYMIQQLPADFEEWYSLISETNPELQWLRQEIAISKQQLSLSKAKSLPGLSAGYVSESLTHEQFRGWAVGITIPLWENKNTVKLARAQTMAFEESLSDRQQQLYNTLRATHARAVSLQQSLNDFRTGLVETEHALLLEKAWRLGELSLINYLLELSFFYDAYDQLLLTEYELNNTMALLRQYEL